jgi:hypothetical protein
LLEKRFVDVVIEEQNIFEQPEHIEKILGILRERCKSFDYLDNL